MSTSAAAPSEMALEFAAVTVPLSRKAGLICGIFSGVAFSGSSSWLTTRSVLPDFTVTGTISAEKLPSRWLFARGERCESKFILLRRG